MTIAACMFLAITLSANGIEGMQRESSRQSDRLDRASWLQPPVRSGG